MIPIGNGNSASAVLPPIQSTNIGEQLLPVLATAADIREFVQYLTLKPNGVVAAEEMDRPKRKLFDERKLAAYRLLGLITSDAVSLKLSSTGWQFAKNFESDSQSFRYLLRQTPPYLAALQWMSDVCVDIITSPEVIDFWYKHFPDAFIRNDDEQRKGMVVSFFSFCQGALLGTMTLGKRGHITRFSTDRPELKRFLEDAPLLLNEEIEKGPTTSDTTYADRFRQHQFRTGTEEYTVLIEDQDSVVVDALQRTLELVQIKAEHTKVGWDGFLAPARSVKKRNNEKRALVVVISEGSFVFDSSGECSLSERVLLGIGAAHILFDQRVLVLADKRVTLRERLAGLQYYEFDGTGMPWELTLQIARVLREFKSGLDRNCSFE